MPPGIVNVPSEAGPLTYSTVEQEGIHLVRYTIAPYCDVIGEALSAYLPGDYLLGDRIVLDPSRLTMADQLTRFTAWESAIRAGWLDKEEVGPRKATHRVRLRPLRSPCPRSPAGGVYRYGADVCDPRGRGRGHLPR